MTLIVKRMCWQVFRRDEVMLLDKSKKGNNWYGYTAQLAQTDFGESCLESAIKHGLVYESNDGDLDIRYLFPTRKGDLIGMSDYDKTQMLDSVKKMGKGMLYAFSVLAALAASVIEIIKISQT